MVGKISTENREPRVPFSSLLLTADNVEVSLDAGWACKGTNTRQSPAWGSSTPQHAPKRRRWNEIEQEFLVQRSLTRWPETYSPLWTKCLSFLFFLFTFCFLVARFPVGENTSLLPCGSNTAQGASGKRGPDQHILFERRDVLPWTKKKNHHRDSRREERCPTCDVMLDQARSAQASPVSDCPRLLPCSDRDWSSMISHVEHRSSRRESRWFFFLSRVIYPRQTLHQFRKVCHA